MIVEIFIVIYTKLLEFFAWILPSWRINDDFLSGFITVIESALAFDAFFPVITLLAVITTIISFEFIVLVAKAGVGILSIVRGGGRIDI
jgi:hypothetical protein